MLERWSASGKREDSALDLVLKDSIEEVVSKDGDIGSTVVRQDDHRDTRLLRVPERRRKADDPTVVAIDQRPIRR